jgi:hypothetical protein
MATPAWLQPWPLVRDLYAKLLREMLRLERMARRK